MTKKNKSTTLVWINELGDLHKAGILPLAAKMDKKHISHNTVAGAT